MRSVPSRCSGMLKQLDLSLARRCGEGNAWPRFSLVFSLFFTAGKTASIGNQTCLIVWPEKLSIHVTIPSFLPSSMQYIEKSDIHMKFGRFSLFLWRCLWLAKWDDTGLAAAYILICWDLHQPFTIFLYYCFSGGISSWTRYNSPPPSIPFIFFPSVSASLPLLP